MPERQETAFDDGDDLPEIRVEAYDKIDHWRDRLDQTAKLEKRNVFERAAADLFLEAEYERDLGAVQAIYDATYVLGRDHAALCDDDIQDVMNGAKAKAERPINGRNKSQSEPRINLANAFTFLGDTLHAPPRELISGLIPAEGVAVTGGQSTAGKTFVEIYKSI